MAVNFVLPVYESGNNVSLEFITMFSDMTKAFRETSQTELVVPHVDFNLAKRYVDESDPGDTKHAAEAIYYSLETAHQIVASRNFLSGYMESVDVESAVWMGTEYSKSLEGKTDAASNAALSAAKVESVGKDHIQQLHQFVNKALVDQTKS